MKIWMLYFEWRQIKIWPSLIFSVMEYVVKLKLVKCYLNLTFSKNKNLCSGHCNFYLYPDPFREIVDPTLKSYKFQVHLHSFKSGLGSWLNFLAARDSRLFSSGSGSWLFSSGSGSWFFFPKRLRVLSFFSLRLRPKGQKKSAPAPDYLLSLAKYYPRKLVR